MAVFSRDGLTAVCNLPRLFPVRDSSIDERIEFLQEEATRIIQANRGYLDNHSHSPEDVDAYEGRKERLYEIFDEIGRLLKAA
jgi:hypothetical protein